MQAQKTYMSLEETNDADEENPVVVHVAEPSRAKWNHIDNLDLFFKHMYQYHQRRGFLCILVEDIGGLIEYACTAWLATYLVFGINYHRLWYNTGTNTDSSKELSEILYPLDVFWNRIPSFFKFVLFIAVLAWLARLWKLVRHAYVFWDMKQFYNVALKISDRDLTDTTWYDVQKRVKQVQLEYQMCIHKHDLTDLDIYHRILRQENYFIAMVNKKLIPPRIFLPFIGEMVYWSRGMHYNMKLLLFNPAFCAPFVNSWELREEFQKENLRLELATKLRQKILVFALINILLAPLVFLWQLFYTLFSYAEVAKQEPGSLTIRNWSLYGQLYLRHFNELEHELKARLSRAYKPAKKYVACFSSPLFTTVTQIILFLMASVFSVMLFLTVLDEKLLQIQHGLFVMTCVGASATVLRKMLPDDRTPACPEALLTNVIMHTHYLPPDWKGHAHTTRVQSHFQQLFQYRAVSLLENLFSPVATPIFLIQYIYPRALDIVDFFRRFTVYVVGVGHVCSFAQMDIKKHGNTEWQEPVPNVQAEPPQQPPDQFAQAEEGKLELSLVHFIHTNPDWKAPREASKFMKNLKAEIGSKPQQEAELHEPPDSLMARDLMSSTLYNSGIDSSIIEMRKIAEELRKPVYVSQAYQNEGAEVRASMDMMISAISLHNRHFQQSRHRDIAEETTPLLVRSSH